MNFICYIWINGLMVNGYSCCSQRTTICINEYLRGFNLKFHNYYASDKYTRRIFAIHDYSGFFVCNSYLYIEYPMLYHAYFFQFQHSQQSKKRKIRSFFQSSLTGSESKSYYSQDQIWIQPYIQILIQNRCWSHTITNFELSSWIQVVEFYWICENWW